MLKTLKTFYKPILERKKIFAVYVLLTIITRSLYSVGPYFYKLFVDTIPTLDYSKLINLLFVYIGVQIVANLTDIASFNVGDHVIIEASKKMRAKVFKYVQDLDFAFHTSKSTGSLISAFKRGDGAYWTIFYTIHHRLADISISFAVMSFFFIWTNKTIGAMLLAAITVSMLAIYNLVKLNIKRRNEFNEEEDKISGHIVDNLIGYETVKLFSKENFEYEKLLRGFRPWTRKLRRFFITFRYIDLVLGIIVNLSLGIILYVAINLTLKGEITIGDFVLIAGYLGTFLTKLWDLVFSFRDIAKNYSDIQKYFKILDHKIQVKDPKNPVNLKNVSGEIEFKNVHFSYQEREKDAINGVSLKIRQGQSIALVGRSGSGKTTIVRLLMRFFDLDKGKIILDGININKFSKSNLRGFMGIVPQEPILFNNTLLFNIGYGKTKATLREVKAAAKLANIGEFIESLPKKYQTIVGERGVKLSGGQKQRVAIARMILANPEIIIFDEATSQLDSESEKLIQEAFWKASKNKTTIIIAHRLSTIMRADRIAVLDQGKIIEIGTHQELLNKKKSLYKHLWDLQLRK